MSAGLSVWQALGAPYRVELFVGLFLAGGNEGLSVSSETVARLGTRGIALELHIHDGGDD